MATSYLIRKWLCKHGAWLGTRPFKSCSKATSSVTSISMPLATNLLSCKYAGSLYIIILLLHVRPVLAHFSASMPHRSSNHSSSCSWLLLTRSAVADSKSRYKTPLPMITEMVKSTKSVEIIWVEQNFNQASKEPPPFCLLPTVSQISSIRSGPLPVRSAAWNQAPPLGLF